MTASDQIKIKMLIASPDLVDDSLMLFVTGSDKHAALGLAMPMQLPATTANDGKESRAWWAVLREQTSKK